MKEDFHDSQFDDVHRVLRNVHGITDAHFLEQVIADVSNSRLVELSKTPLSGNFDIPHLRSIHRYIFQDVFPWAGDFREVMTARTGSFGFPPPIYIEPSLNDLFTKLRLENSLMALDRDQFATRAAYYLGELNAIHPFREGNGRAQREFIRQLALVAGHPLSWKNITKEENDEASRVSFATGNSGGLAIILRKCLL